MVHKPCVNSSLIHIYKHLFIFNLEIHTYISFVANLFLSSHHHYTNVCVCLCVVVSFSVYMSAWALYLHVYNELKTAITFEVIYVISLFMVAKSLHQHCMLWMHFSLNWKLIWWLWNWQCQQKFKPFFNSYAP